MSVRCPSCGNEVPPETAQHALAPAAGVVQCPTCGEKVSLAGGGGEATAGADPRDSGLATEIEDEHFSGHETMAGVKEEIEAKEDE
jgi:hypothetical protein